MTFFAYLGMGRSMARQHNFGKISPANSFLYVVEPHPWRRLLLFTHGSLKSYPGAWQDFRGP